MQRTRTNTKHSDKCIPDMINRSANKNFTMLPNELIRNPEISAKAKTVLAIGLSNKEGWYSYLSVIQSMMKEGETAISNAIKIKSSTLLSITFLLIVLRIFTPP